MGAISPWVTSVAASTHDRYICTACIQGKPSCLHDRLLPVGCTTFSYAQVSVRVLFCAHKSSEPSGRHTKHCTFRSFAAMHCAATAFEVCFPSHVHLLSLHLCRIKEAELTLGNGQSLTSEQVATRAKPVGPFPLVYGANVATDNFTVADVTLCAPYSLNASAIRGPTIVVSIAASHLLTCRCTELPGRDGAQWVPPCAIIIPPP